MDAVEADLYRRAYFEIMQIDPGPERYQIPAIRTRVIRTVDTYLSEIKAMKAALSHQE